MPRSSSADFATAAFVGALVDSSNDGRAPQVPGGLRRRRRADDPWSPSEPTCSTRCRRWPTSRRSWRSLCRARPDARSPRWTAASAGPAPARGSGPRGRCQGQKHSLRRPTGADGTAAVATVNGPDAYLFHRSRGRLLSAPGDRRRCAARQSHAGRSVGNQPAAGRPWCRAPRRVGFLVAG